MDGEEVCRTTQMPVMIKMGTVENVSSYATVSAA